jgi:hypothetical protein
VLLDVFSSIAPQAPLARIAFFGIHKKKGMNEIGRTEPKGADAVVGHVVASVRVSPKGGFKPRAIRDRSRATWTEIRDRLLLAAPW